MRAERYYRSLWALPDTKTVFAEWVASQVIAAALALHLYGQIAAMRITAALLSATGILVALAPAEKTLNVKRILGISLFLTVFNIAYLLLTPLLSPYSAFIQMFVLILVSTALMFFSGRLILSVLASLAISWVYTYTFTATVDAPMWIHMYLALFPTAFSLTFLGLIELYSLKGNRYGAASMFRAFLALWLNGDPGPLERIFSKDSSEKTISFDILLIRGEGEVALTALPIHPGPIRNVGGSNITGILMSLKDRIVAPFHGPSSHELNLPTTSSKERLIKEILSSMNRANGWEELRFSRLISLNSGPVRVIGFRVNGTCILSITGSPNSIEDIHPYVYEEVRKKAIEMGFKGCIVIDAHNSLEDQYLDKDYVSAAALEGAERMVKLLAREQETGGMVGVHRSPGIMSVADGYGSGGLVAIIFRNGLGGYGLVLIDGNNMVRGLRDRIVNEAMRRYGLAIEIATTDTHEVTAVRPGKGYRRVGEVGRELFTEWVLSSISKATSKLHSAKATVVKVETVVPVMGKSVEEINRLIERNAFWGKIYPYAALASSLLAAMLPKFIANIP